MRATLGEQPYWTSMLNNWEKTLLTENEASSVLRKHLQSLSGGEEGALSAALTACPGLMVNLRPGATKDLEELILKAVAQEIDE
eukprot:1541024-Lingulodinium_polyedra.AAC.1